MTCGINTPQWLNIYIVNTVGFNHKVMQIYWDFINAGSTHWNWSTVVVFTATGYLLDHFLNQFCNFPDHLKQNGKSADDITPKLLWKPGEIMSTPSKLRGQREAPTRAAERCGHGCRPICTVEFSAPEIPRKVYFKWLKRLFTFCRPLLITQSF